MSTDNSKQSYIDFESYEQVKEPHKREKASTWRAAIGLQDVDGLKVSEYLKETAVKHIEGDISIDDVRKQLQTYYDTKTIHNDNTSDTEEADKVAANIAKLLSEKSFSLSALELLNIHKHIFDGVFKHAGEVRPFDISKKEWVLNGESVVYGRADDIMLALRYDIEQEQVFNYAGLSTMEMIEHIAHFTSLLWQNHPFREGNTRTTAVFIIKYLRSCGFEVNNDVFAENSWYFRNALVRANYQNPTKSIWKDNTFLIKFFCNLLLGENHELRNRFMQVNYNTIKDTHTSTHTSNIENTHTSSHISNNNQLLPKSDNVHKLIIAIGRNELSVKEMMTAIRLQNRPNFMEYSLSPAITEGYVRMKYPQSPRHPRQKYLLTLKGLMVFNSIK
ncbi:MAG: Fic family protein [Bacteroidales bacterium]|nr:Fic family protein [Bacteroidales bacterium]